MKARSRGSFAVVAALTVSAAGCGDEIDGPPTIQQIQAEIFDPSCATAGCHAGPQPAQMLDLTAPSRAALVGVESTQITKPLVDPGNVGNSYLYDKITGQMLGAGTSMMPLVGSLPQDQIDLIRRWIEAGAP